MYCSEPTELFVLFEDLSEFCGSYTPLLKIVGHGSILFSFPFFPLNTVLGKMGHSNHICKPQFLS